MHSTRPGAGAHSQQQTFRNTMNDRELINAVFAAAGERPFHNVRLQISFVMLTWYFRAIRRMEGIFSPGAGTPGKR